MIGSCPAALSHFILFSCRFGAPLLRARNREIKSTDDGFPAAKEPWRPGCHDQLGKRATNNDSVAIGIGLVPM